MPPYVSSVTVEVGTFFVETMMPNEKKMRALLELTASDTVSSELRATKTGALSLFMLAAKIADYWTGGSASTIRSGTWKVDNKFVSVNLTRHYSKKFGDEVTVSYEVFERLIIEIFGPKIIILPLTRSDWDDFQRNLNQKQRTRVNIPTASQIGGTYGHQSVF
ncbi:MAG: hypothetical protein AUK16_01315 [Parcubacteria group bacterium CG2_30_44_11]|nr:MAG: hypothetical protein AUK16_01315 [Parcubacteria group bacterium CG2_30_44_11]